MTLIIQPPFYVAWVIALLSNSFNIAAIVSTIIIFAQALAFTFHVYFEEVSIQIFYVQEPSYSFRFRYAVFTVHLFALPGPVLSTFDNLLGTVTSIGLQLLLFIIKN